MSLGRDQLTSRLADRPSQRLGRVPLPDARRRQPSVSHLQGVAAVLHSWQAAFDRAATVRPRALCERHYIFGGKRVEAYIAGETLAEHTDRAFGHLRAEPGSPGAPQLRIALWDESAMGVSRPAGAANDLPVSVHRAEGGLVSIHAGGRVFRYEGEQSITWLDRAAKLMVGWRASADRLSLDERSKPLPLLLRLWYEDRNIHFVHAGLVARDGQGVVIAGKSGTGKTTTALACALQGFDFLGDDQFGLEAAKDGAFVGHSLYSGARVAGDHLHNFPRLLPHTLQSDEGTKSLTFLSEISRGRVARNATIRAVILPRISGGGAVRIEAAGPTEALLRVAPSSLFIAFGAGAAGFDRLRQLVQSVPCYRLDLGRDLDQVAVCLRRVLERTSAT
jgi:hypothetical protein